MARRLVDWTRSGIITGGAQAAVQLLGFVSGIIVVRCLAPQQYAFYTISTAALGTMTVLADGGINSGVLARGGAVWRDAAKLGTVLATGLQLRRQLALLALSVSLPLTTVLLHHQGAPWGAALMVAVSIVPLFLATVTGHLLEAVPRLHQTLWPLQRIQLLSNFGRLVILAIVTPWSPSAAVVSLAAAPPQWWANRRLHTLADRYARWRTASDADVRSHLLAQLRRTLPAAMYYSVSSQLTVWLISIAGHATAVAAVGALGRLAMLLTIFSSMFAVLAVPRFARIPAAERALLLRRYWQSQAALLLACAVPLAALNWFPDRAVAVLGPHYTGLEREAVFMAASSGAAILSGAAFSLAAARGIVVPPLTAVPYCLLIQVGLIALLPVESVAGVILVGLLSSLSQWVLHVAYFQWSLRRSAPGVKAL